MHYTAVSFSALLGLASAQKLHVVSVSGEGDWALKFSPDNIKVPVGDMIQFQFRAGNHSVVQSTFDNPCEPIKMHTGTEGFYSGYQPVAASEEMDMIPTYTIMVKDEKPMWVYCSQGQHCQNGMTMVVNENTAANSSRSLEEYRALAAEAPDNLGGDVEGIGGETGTTEPGNDQTAPPGGEETPATPGGDEAPGDGNTNDGTSGGNTGDDTTVGTPGEETTPTPGSDATPTGTAGGASTSIAQGGASMVTVTSPMGVLALAAAFFML
ncbi:hypothetical protein DL766_004054 [Monosporascus sp. MC13-8B]|uniref:Phytocyanin domain-containing protein n=1 Tax=Monosporascus cannonballus TaxID=155416 RepID=A0ABY0H184_9PEZI|nr:hypothetical protein DL762_007095 [Monosporascus cannonballus]RYO99135.1 hypothetical protein DL763_001736 [Monosporascus cannonballus]RYP32214.1 hypothetical protein DL766_004054 [Monosporascus sp. MC13-8B]